MYTKEERRSEIMEVSSSLFYEKGIADTTISEIAYLSNIGKGTFYEYFKNKDDVINEYIKNYFQEVNSQISQEIDTFKTNKEKILFIVSSLFKIRSSDEKFTYIFVEFLRLTCNKKKEDCKKLHHFNDQNIRLICSYLEEGIEQNEFIQCDVQKVALEIISAILGNLILSLSYNFKECDNSMKTNVETILEAIEVK